MVYGDFKGTFMGEFGIGSLLREIEESEGGTVLRRKWRIYI